MNTTFPVLHSNSASISCIALSLQVLKASRDLSFFDYQIQLLVGSNRQRHLYLRWICIRYIVLSLYTYERQVYTGVG